MEGGALVPVRLKATLLARLDAWISKHNHNPSRPAAVRELLEQVLGKDEEPAAAEPTGLDQRIGHLEGTVAELKPIAAGEPSPAKGMAMLRRGHAKSELAKAKNKRARKRPE